MILYKVGDLKMNIIKKITVGLTILLFFSSVVTGNLGLNLNEGEENFEILTFNFLFQKPKLENIEYGNIIYTNVYIEELPNQGNTNQPLLPVKPLKILIPEGRDIDTIEVKTEDERSCLMNKE